jgi:hypothetical protein
MTITITLDSDSLNRLDLSLAEVAIDKLLQEGKANSTNPEIVSPEQQIRFEIDYSRDPADPREISEIPEIRLWFVRLDARYPWLPLLLDWEAGELGRYTAMLVPHQFSPEGIQFNPEALEIFVMHKVFILADWMQQRGITSPTKIKFMTQILGYELEDGFFELIGF